MSKTSYMILAAVGLAIGLGAAFYAWSRRNTTPINSIPGGVSGGGANATSNPDVQGIATGIGTGLGSIAGSIADAIMRNQNQVNQADDAAVNS